MIKKRSSPKIFFGWWTVLGGGIIALWGHGYHVLGFSALFKPIASELGFSRAVTSVAASIGRFEGGVEAPVAGWLTDKFGPKLIVFSGVFLAGLGLVLMKFINSLWAFYVVWGVVLGTGCNISLSVPLDKAVTDWFVKKRGLAIGIRWVFTGLAAVLVLPLVGWLISIQGWRMTCVIGGVVMWLVGLPLAWFCVKRHRPEYYGLLPDGATMKEEAADTSQMIDRGVKYAAEVEEVEFTLRQALRTFAYWLLAGAQAFHSGVSAIIILHAIPFLTDMGIDPVKAAVMMGMMSSSILPGMFIGGFVADRVKKQHLRFILGGAYLLEVIGIALFVLKPTMAMVYPFFILCFFGFGLNIPLNSVIRARYFGRKAFGSIRGTSTTFIQLFGVIAPIYAGWVYDTTGSYITCFTLFAALCAFGALIAALAFPPKPPAEVTDIRKIL